MHPKAQLRGTLLLLVACGSDPGRSESTTAGETPASTGPASGSSSPTTSTTTSTSTGAVSDASSGAPTSSPTSGPLFDLGERPNLKCSPDLHAVVDDADQLVETCPPDQGCKDAACVPACEAAAAGQTNFGCEFHIATPPSSPYLPKQPCFAAFLTNSWGHPAHFEVSRGGQQFVLADFARVVEPGKEPKDWAPVPAQGLEPGQVAVLFLSQDAGAFHPESMLPLVCPVDPPAVNVATQLGASGRGLAFHVTADIPLAAYDIAPFGGATSYIPSAELLFPTSVWGVNYVTILPPEGTYDPPGPLWIQIVGGTADTQVQINPSVALAAGMDLAAVGKGVPAAFTVGAGEFLQWQVAPGSVGGSGTVILSDKPIAVHTGNRFLRLQAMPGPGGEATHQQISAVANLGHEYVAAPFETRRKDLAPELITYRFVGAVDGTTLAFNPALPGAPAGLALGEVVDFAATSAFTVRSQDDAHPFLLAQRMDTANIPGGTRPGATDMNFPPNLGDEEFVVMLPPAQFLQDYVFFTDPSFATTNLVLTRVKQGDGFADVTVDCLGVVGGWKPVGDEGLTEVTTVDLVRADIGVGGCSNGHHTASSDGPFGVVVWGLDSYSSYAYPAGGSARALTDVVVPPG